MRLIVAIPTAGRRQVIAPTVRDIARQTRLPDLVLVVIAQADDIDAGQLGDLPFPVQIVTGERGSTLQRNAALDLMAKGDIALFLDDDFLMAPDYLANMETLFASRPDVVMATGTVLADGIHGPGLLHGEGYKIASAPAPSLPPRAEEIYNCYGCNMAVRTDVATEHRIRFDARMKLYAWLEDVDFSRQMAVHGRIVKSTAMRGVHLGTKVGRSSGLRVGYVQIANPLYLIAKGTMSWPRALNILCRNLASNLVKSLRPEAEIDRRGRLRGNLSAIGDMLLGRMAPERVLKFK